MGDWDNAAVVQVLRLMAQESGSLRCGAVGTQLWEMDYASSISPYAYSTCSRTVGLWRSLRRAGRCCISRCGCCRAWAVRTPSGLIFEELKAGS